MTILFICDEYPPGPNGGIGSAVQTLARQLHKDGNKVLVAGLYSYGYGQADLEVDHGVTVYRKRYGFRLPVKPGNRLYNLRHKLPDVLKRAFNGSTAFESFVEFIQELIVREKADIVEIADYNNFCEHIGRLVSWPRFSVPLVVKSHGSHTYFCHEQGISPNSRLEQTDRLLFKRADALSSVSRYTAEVNKILFGSQNSVTLYNGINFGDLPVSRNYDDARTVIFSGSITQKKGIFQLAKAWNLVKIKVPDAKLFIYGKGKIQDLKTLLDLKNIDSVIFMGHVKKEILMEHLANAGAAVFPSYTETFGLGPVEAMSVGCPVIYTRRSCGPEIVSENVDGLLVDPDNLEEIAERIVDLLDDIEKRERLGQAAIRSSRARFDISSIAVDHIRFYRQVISGFGRE